MIGCMCAKEQFGCKDVEDSGGSSICLMSAHLYFYLALAVVLGRERGIPVTVACHLIHRWIESLVFDLVALFARKRHFFLKLKGRIC